MKEADIIAAFAQVARPVILQYFPANCCIAASRIAVECFGRFGVFAEAVPVGFVVDAPALRVAYISGLRGEVKDELKRKAGSYTDLLSDGWDGHLVAVAGRESRYVVDASFDQCGVPALGVNVLPYILIIPLPEDIPADSFAADARLRNDDGAELRVRYVPLDDRSFEDQPAWELDHLQPAIREITRLMSEALEGSEIYGV